MRRVGAENEKRRVGAENKKRRVGAENDKRRFADFLTNLPNYSCMYSS